MGIIKCLAVAGIYLGVAQRSNLFLNLKSAIDALRHLREATPLALQQETHFKSLQFDSPLVEISSKITNQQ